MALSNQTAFLTAILLSLGGVVAHKNSKAYSVNYADCQRLSIDNSQNYVCTTTMNRSDGLEQIFALNQAADREEYWHFDRETQVWTDIGQWSSEEITDEQSRYAFDVHMNKKLLVEKILESPHSMLVHNHPLSREEKGYLERDTLTREEYGRMERLWKASVSPSDRDIKTLTEAYHLAKKENPSATLQGVIVSAYGLTTLEPREANGEVEVHGTFVPR